MICNNIHIYSDNTHAHKIYETYIILQLYRHGDRTPISPYPTDPYRNETSWPVPYGELTNVSM